MAVFYSYNATLIRVIDGDTLDAMIDLGFDVWVKKRIRLNKIDAPETRTKDLEEKKRGLETKERLTHLLEQNNGEFVVESYGVGKYGRCLGTIYVNGKNINAQLLSERLAKEYEG